VADHARRGLPEEYGSLGLPVHEFDRHIAYDIGVEEVTLELAALTGAPAVLANVSRLLIDPNRGDDDPTLIRQLYACTIVPGIYRPWPEVRERRQAQFYRTYHAVVSALIASAARASVFAPFILSVIPLTTALQAVVKPWHEGVLWERDTRAPRQLI